MTTTRRLAEVTMYWPLMSTDPDEWWSWRERYTDGHEESGAAECDEGGDGECEDSVIEAEMLDRLQRHGIEATSDDLDWPRDGDRRCVWTAPDRSKNYLVD